MQSCSQQTELLKPTRVSLKARLSLSTQQVARVARGPTDGRKHRTYGVMDPKGS